MSLINQMLRDLEARRTTGAAGSGVLSGLAPSVSPGSRRLLVILGAVIALLSIALAGLIWERLVQERPSAPAAAASPRAGAPAPAALPAQARERPAGTFAPPTVPLTAPTAPAGATPVGGRVAAATSDAPRQELTPPPARGDTSPKPRAQVGPPSAAAAAPPKGVNTRRAPKPKTHAPKADARSSIEKHKRPPTPRQRAMLAYQDAAGLLQDGRTADAIARLRAALHEDPGHLQARETLAGLLLRQGQAAEAARLLEEGLRQRPGEPEFAILLARIHVQQGELDEAVKVLEASMSGRSGAPESYAFLAALQQRQGHYRESVASYRQALERDPRQGVWWMGMAISLERATEPGPAAEAYDRALEAGGLSGPLRQYCLGRKQALGRGD